MIEELHISHLGVIKEARLPLSAGLNVLTGETGAGKTMLVTALELLLGGKADAGMVSDGGDAASVEALLQVSADSGAVRRTLEAGGVIEDDTLLIARRIAKQGRSRAFAGGTATPVAVLAEIVGKEITVHGQSEQIWLRSTSQQRAILDAYAGEEFAQKLQEYQDHYTAWAALGAELAELQSSQYRREAEEQAMRKGLELFDALQPEPGEDERLKAESIRLSHVEQLRRAAVVAQNLLSAEELIEGETGSDVLDSLGRAVHELHSVAHHDETLKNTADRIDEVVYTLQDAHRELSDYVGKLADATEADISQVEERRAQLAALLRIWGPTISDAIEQADAARQSLETWEDNPALLARLQAEREEHERYAQEFAKSLHQSRVRAASALGEAVSEELTQLAMPHAQLVIEVADGSELQRYGTDSVEFRFAPHPGSAPRPLSKAGSGGELSRIMLGIEVVLAQVSKPRVFVFDEVDSGVGGSAAVEIGRRLSRLAQHSQVLVVTHLPQVAAFADQHIRVTKMSNDRDTTSILETLGQNERIRELARMLAGYDETAVAKEHAKELLQAAEKDKLTYFTART